MNWAAHHDSDPAKLHRSEKQPRRKTLESARREATKEVLETRHFCLPMFGLSLSFSPLHVRAEILYFAPERSGLFGAHPSAAKP